MSSPISPGDDPSTFGEADLRAQIRAEVIEAAHQVGNQLKLSDVLELGGGSQVSRIAKGQAGLTVERARRLDKWQSNHGRETLCGSTLETLVDCLKRALVDARSKNTDVFVACPMSAAGPAYEGEIRGQAMSVVKALRKTGLDAYSAVEDIKTASVFDGYDFAYRANLRHINASRLFVLYIPIRPAMLTDARDAPSSIWIELGMALARGIPCTIFTPDILQLPYIVRQTVSDETTKTVLDVRVYSKPNEPANWIKRHGRGYLLGDGRPRS